MTSKDTLPHPELSAALGHIVRLCSNLEGVISILIGNLIGPDRQIGEIVTSGLSFNSLSALLNALFRYRVPDSQSMSDLERLLRRAEACERRRNQLIHAAWTNFEKEGFYIRMKSSKRSTGFRKDQELVSQSNLDDAIEDTDKLITDFASFLIKHVIPYRSTQARSKKFQGHRGKLIRPFGNNALRKRM